MEVLVLGGLGFIGHNVVRRLADDGHTVSYISPPTEHHSRLKEIRKEYIGTSANQIKLHWRATERQYDVVVDCAGIPNAKAAKEFPSKLIDGQLIVPTTFGFEYRPPERFQYIYLSSSMVYGNFVGKPNEESALNPIEPYGIVKRTAEQLFEHYNHFDYTIIRPSAVYGPRDKIERVLSKFMLGARSGRPLKVKGHHVLDFTYVDDLVDGISKCVGNPVAYNEIFNMTRGQGATLQYVAEAVARTVGGNVSISYDESDPLYPTRGALDITKASTMLGYNPTIDIEEGIRLYHDNWISEIH